MYLYRIDVCGTDQFYIGITNDVERRKKSHQYRATKGYKTHLYDVIRKYGTFELTVLEEFETRKQAGDAEKEMIKFFRDIGAPIMNHAGGGDGGFVVTNTDEWREKLCIAREGRKPAQGMQHSPENKKLFSEVSQAYWNTQDTYDKYGEEILKPSHKEAKEKFGISTTHYYRLKKRFKSNDLG